MKRILLAIFAIALFGSFANATKYMCIKLNSGETLYYPVDDIVDANVSRCELPANEVGGFEYVDLGLPSGLLWATHNIGAFESYEYGDYYAYGETTTKDKYVNDNSAWLGGLAERYKKASDFFVENNDTILKLEDDAAYVNWGNDWRMPTFRDQQELIEGCTWAWKENYQESGINGILGTSKVNKNTIFFPAAGNKFTMPDSGFPYEYYNPENSTWSENGMVVMGASTHKYGDGVQWKCEIIASSDGNKVVWYGHSHNPGYVDYYNPGVAGGVTIRPVVNKSCRVIFVDTYSNKKYEVYVPQGGIAVSPVTPSMPGKQFAGWSKSTDRVTEDMTVFSMFNDIVTISGTVGKYDYVDLGLSSGTIWATYNVGAANAAEGGDRFAWGETEAKDQYTSANYKWWDAKSSTYTKYSAESDKKTELDSEDDAATANWGDDWRIPTKEEMDELLAACTWELSEDYKGSGLSGVVGTSSSNGATIFFPKSGKEKALYLESSLAGEGLNPSRANSLYFSTSVEPINYEVTREKGAYVRPVIKKSYKVVFTDTCSNKKYEVNVPQGGIAVSPVTPSVPGKEFAGWSESTDNVQKNMTVYAIFRDIVTVSGTKDKYEYVDLGLPSGTKWATYNVGAKNAAECGAKFAWGETEAKDQYTSANYKWWDAKSSTYTKYSAESDKKTELDSEDDAATANWGDGWRIPTKEEMDELLAACTWEMTNNFKGSGLSGMVGTSSSNGATIFFPKSGKEKALYLESSLAGEGLNPSRANSLYFSTSVEPINYEVTREKGAYVRPVVK